MVADAAADLALCHSVRRYGGGMVIGGLILDLVRFERTVEGVLRSIDVRPGCPWSHMECTRALMRDFAREGKRRWLRWMHRRGHVGPPDMCRHAAGGGHTSCLAYLCKIGYSCDFGTAAAAAEGGHLQTLQWLRARDQPCPWDGEASRAATVGGHIDCLRYLHENGCPFGPAVGLTPEWSDCRFMCCIAYRTHHNFPVPNRGALAGFLMRATRDHMDAITRNDGPCGCEKLRVLLTPC